MREKSPLHDEKTKKQKNFRKKCNLPEKNLYIGMEAQEQEVKTWRMSR